MAEYLASIFGTEKDKVNCSFYFKIGACRHGDKCSRIHNKPTFSQTILLQNLYQNPKRDMRGPNSSSMVVSDAEEQQHFDEFFEEIFTELEDKYGEIEEMNVCDNIGEHMIGNVYVKFKREEDATKAVEDLNNRWFGGMPVYAELSPVTDFREACCRQYEMGECRRGGFCNFMHLKPISYDLRRELYNRDHPWRTVPSTSKQDQKVPTLSGIKVPNGVRKKLKLVRSILSDESDPDVDENLWRMLEYLQSPNGRPVAAEITNSKDDVISLPKAYVRPETPSSWSECSSLNDWLESPCFVSKIDSGVLYNANCIEKEGLLSDCGKGGFCNFMHLKPISRELRKRLYGRSKGFSPPYARSGRQGGGGGPEGGRGGGGGGGGGGGDRGGRRRSRSREYRGGRY